LLAEDGLSPVICNCGATTFEVYRDENNGDWLLVCPVCGDIGWQSHSKRAAKAGRGPQDPQGHPPVGETGDVGADMVPASEREAEG